MPAIFFASGDNAGKWFPIRKKSLVLGRDESLVAQVVGERVSRKHLQIAYEAEEDAYYALDLKSKNGVFVNDKKITDRVKLNEDDLIRIGDQLLLFTLTDIQDDQNALNFYKMRGMKSVPTVSQKLPVAEPEKKRR